MSKSEPIEPAKKRTGWHPFRWFEWIDRIESEGARRVIQGVISTLIGAAILGTFAFVWTQREQLIGGSKSLTQFILNLLQTPIELKVWVVFLIVVAVVWVLYLFSSRKRFNGVSAAFENIQSKLTGKTLRQISEIEAQVIESTKVMHAATELIEQKKKVETAFTPEQLSRFGKRNKTSVPNPTDEAVLKHRREIIHIIHEKLILIKRAVENATLQKNPDSERTQLVERFWYLAQDFQTYFELNKIYIPSDVASRIEDYRLNLQASLLQFTQAMAESKLPRKEDSYGKLFNNYFETTRQAELKHEALIEDFKAILCVLKPPNEITQKAVTEIYEKLLPLLNSWEDCTALIEDATEGKLKERQAKFQAAVDEFNNEFETRKLLMTIEVAKDFQTLANKTIDYVRKCDKAAIFQKSNPKNPEMMDAHYLPIDALKNEIPVLRHKLEGKIRSILN